MRNLLLALAVFGLLPVALAAQDHEGHSDSPYVDLQPRDIKALSPADVEALLTGDGMGFALAAELNGHPGPKHVLELADALELTGEQRQRTEALMRDMQSRARALGAELVDGERALDRAFAAGAIDAAGLRDLVARIEKLRGDLRAAHLEAHIATTNILSEHQRRQYQTLRGYAADPHPTSGG